MNKKLKVLASALSLLLVSATLAGCGNSSSSGTTQGGKLPTGKTITISTYWTEEIPQLTKEAQAWAKETGNSVKVIKDTDSDFSKLIVAAKSAEAPDVVIGVPHDRIGSFAKAGILQAAPAGQINASDYISNEVVQAGEYDGKQYGVPFFTETYALFYNKDKVKDVPKTWDDLLTDAKADGGFEYDLNTLYFSYPLLANNGAYIFKNDNGKLDPKNIGLDKSAPGFQMMQDIINKGIMTASVTGDIAKGDFQSGKTAFYISGPWDVDSLRKAGVNFGIAKLPNINGNPAQSFMGVQTGVVLKNTKNSALDWDLMKYLSQNDNIAAIGKVGNRIPAKKGITVPDASLQGFADQMKSAVPMPNIPEMSPVWTAASSVLQLVTTEKMTPAAAAAKFQSDVKSGINTMSN